MRANGGDRTQLARRFPPRATSGVLRSRRAELIEKCFTDQQWALVESQLPGKNGDPGCTARDNRLFLEAVLWIARTGRPWRELPPEFGKWFTAYARFRRWTQKGVWPRVFETLTRDPEFHFALIGRSIRPVARDPSSSAAVDLTDGGRVAA
jgi:putative transposase